MTLDQNSNNQGLSNTILNAAAEYVLNLYNQVHEARLVYHTYQRSSEIVKLLDEVAEAEQASDEVHEIAKIAAWFQDTGHLIDYNNHEDRSIENAREFLNMQGYPKHKIERVLNCINATRPGVRPTDKESRILVDAIHAFEATANFFFNRPLLRVEWELMANRHLPENEWLESQLNFLLNASFYTTHGKNNFSPAVAQNILSQKQKLDKVKKSAKAKNLSQSNLRKFQGLERKIPERATQTFFRANYRNHINLSIIADNKANIMISVNAILISVIISLLSYKNITDTNPMVLLPVVIFLVTGLASLIFAVLSIRPKVTSLLGEKFDLDVAKRNIIFFGNFVNLSLEQYEDAMDAMFRDSELLYGNMTRDMYYLGKVLDKKYRFLTISYNIFMVGFIATVFTFLFATFS